MPSSSQSRNAVAQFIEDVFFDAPEELFEDPLESQSDEVVRRIELHAYLAYPEKDHFPDLPARFLHDRIQKFQYQEPAPFDIDDPEYEMLLEIEEALINLQKNYEDSMKLEVSKFSRIMALYEKVINRPYDPLRICTLAAVKKEKALYVGRLNEITRVQELLDREYLVDFKALEKQAVAIMNKWHAHQASLAVVPHKLVIEDHVRWTLLRQKQLEYVHDKTKNLVQEQANRIRALEYALAVTQQAPVAAPYIYHTPISMSDEQLLAEADNIIHQKQLNDGFQNAVQPGAYLAQFDKVAVPNGQERMVTEENVDQAQQQHGFKVQENLDLTANARASEIAAAHNDQQEVVKQMNNAQQLQPWNFQSSATPESAFHYRDHDDDTISNGRTEIIPEESNSQVGQAVNVQPQEIPEPDNNLPQNQSNVVTPNSQEEPLTTGADIFQEQENVDHNTQVQQPADSIPAPPLNVAVPIVQNQQAYQNSYVNLIEYEEDPGRMYPLYSHDPIKKAWAKKKLDLDFEKKELDTIDQMMNLGRSEAAMKKWAEAVRNPSEEDSPQRQAAKRTIQDFDEDEEPDDEYGRKRTFGTYEEDDEAEEEHSRKRLRPMTRVKSTPTPSLNFEVLPEDPTDLDMWEEPAKGYIGHDGVYYDHNGRGHYMQDNVPQEPINYDSNERDPPVRQNNPSPPQLESPSPPSVPVSRTRSRVLRFSATRRNGSVPARLSRQRMRPSQWSQWQNNRTTPR